MAFSIDNISGWTRRTAEVLDASTLSPSVPHASPKAGGWAGLTTLIPSGATVISSGTLINLNATPAFLDIFDTAGVVTLGTTTPTATIPLCANATAANGSGLTSPFNMKITSGKVQIAVVTAQGGATPVTTGIFGTIFGNV